MIHPPDYPGFDDKKLRIFQDLYYSQSAMVWLRDKISEEFSMEKGVRQNCVCSPDRFSLYNEKKVDEIDEMPGVLINVLCIDNMRYADDTLL